MRRKTADTRSGSAPAWRGHERTGRGAAEVLGGAGSFESISAMNTNTGAVFSVDWFSVVDS